MTDPSRLHDAARRTGRARGSTTCAAAGSPSGELAGLGRPRHPGPHVEPVDLPEGDQHRLRLRRAVRRPHRRRHRPSPTPTGTSSPPTSRAPSPSCDPCTTSSDGVDGYVSVEVAPDLARDSAGTEAAARQLHEAIDEPNLYVKIPGTAEGVAPIRAMIAEGRSINVTLIFSLDRYAEVMEAYLARPRGGRGRPQPHLERGQLLHLAGRHRGRPPPRGDRHRRRPGAPRHGRRSPRPRWPTSGSVDTFQGPRWDALVGPRRAGAATAVGLDVHEEPGLPRHGLRRPAHRTGHGQHDARGDDRGVPRPRHGRVARSTPTRRPPQPRSTRWPRWASTSTTSAEVLEEQGVAAFAKSFDELIGALDAKAAELGAG